MPTRRLRAEILMAGMISRVRKSVEREVVNWEFRASEAFHFAFDGVLDSESCGRPFGDDHYASGMLAVPEDAGA